MNRKQLFILILVMAVLGGAALMLLRKDAESRKVGTHSDGSGLLAALPVGEELAVIRITSGTNTLTLAKQDGVWGVKQRDGYPANYTEISRAVLQLRDLKATQTEPVTESQLARLKLLPPGSGDGTGTLVEFQDSSNQPLGALLLGKEQTRTETAPSQFGDGGPREVPVGRWVRTPDNKTSVALVSEPLSNIRTSPAAWLDKDFFKVEKIRSVRVDYPNAPTNSFELSRDTEGGSWTLDALGENEELDASKTSSFNHALSSPSFNDVITSPDDAALGLDNPTRITVQTFDGFRYEVQAGTKLTNNIPMRVTVTASYARERVPSEDEDESVKTQADKTFADTLKQRDEKLETEQAFGRWTYLVSSWTLDPLLKKRGELIKEKEVSQETPAEDPSNLTDELIGLPPTK